MSRRNCCKAVNSISRVPRKHSSVYARLHTHAPAISSSAVSILLSLRRGSRIFRIFHQRTEVVYYEPRMCTKAWGVLRMLAITFTFALSSWQAVNEQAVFSFGLPSAGSKDHPFSLPPILPSFFSFPSSRLPAFLASNQRIGSRLPVVGENTTQTYILYV